MPIKRYFRIFWTFIWRFMLAYYVLNYAGQTFSYALMRSVEQELTISYYIVLGFAQMAALILATAYGLWAVFNAKYKHFDIDVRTDKAVDAF